MSENRTAADDRGDTRGLSDVAVIDRFAVTWLADEPELAAADLDTDRFDGLVTAVLDGPLEEALAGLGLPVPAEVCIRRLEVPLQRLWLDDQDRDFVDRWSRAIGHTVARAVAGVVADGVAHGGPTASGAAGAGDVVVYRSMAHALSDLVAGAATGDLDRVWAWRQLGLWPTTLDAGRGAAVEVAVLAMLDRPTLISATFAAVSATGRLAALVDVLGPHVVALAGAAWAAAGGGAESCPAPALPAPVPTLEQAYAVARSRFAMAAAPIAARADLPVRRALALLAVAIVEPGSVTHPAAPSVVGVVATLLADDGASAASSGRGLGEADRLLVDSQAGHVVGPAAGVTEPPPVEPATTLAPVAGQRDPARNGDPAALTGKDAQAPAVPADRAWRTGWGGLLFLLHVVGDLGWPEADEGPLAALGLRTVLHQVGLDALGRAAPDAVPPRPDDPAVLAFCGLAPGDGPPDGIPDVHVAGLHRLTDALVEGLRTRLQGLPLALVAEPSLLLSVCRRRARIVADPGWTDLVLELDEVSVDVRVAGLDLDPGYLPWLGSVVRFVYG